MASISYQANKQGVAGSNNNNNDNSSINNNETVSVSILASNPERPKWDAKTILITLGWVIVLALGVWLIFDGHNSSDHQIAISIPAKEGGVDVTSASTPLPPSTPAPTSATTNLAEIGNQIAADLDRAISRWEIDIGKFDEGIRDRLATGLDNLQRRLAHDTDADDEATEAVAPTRTVYAAPKMVRPTTTTEKVIRQTITMAPWVVTPTLYADGVVKTTTITAAPSVEYSTITAKPVPKKPVTQTHHKHITPVIENKVVVTPTHTAEAVVQTQTVIHWATVTPTITKAPAQITPTITAKPLVATMTVEAPLVIFTPTIATSTSTKLFVYEVDDCQWNHVDKTEEELLQEREDYEREWRKQRAWEREHPGEVYN